MLSQQRLIRLQITRLKNLTDVTIEFENQKYLTAILGPNGFGKSTVLHALAASFKPHKVTHGYTVSKVGEDHRYIDFFPNTPHGTWSSTSFNIVHFFREGTDTQTSTLQVSKDIRQWFPIATKRPEREVHFIGVSSSVPAIEQGWPRSKIRYTTNDLSDPNSLEILQKAGFILNRDYTRYHTNKLSSRSSLIGVQFQGVNYSALSMGAGEQRLFHLLRKVKTAGNYSLILIDELDLLLHTDALHRLLGVLNEYAKEKNLQIIFTTHRESVVNFDSFVAIRHIYRSPVAPYRTFCFEETKPDALTRLTGHPHRLLSVCCEDDVSTAIVKKIAQQSGVRKFVDISCFGAADNCFTLAAALLLSGQNLENSLFVLDGDIYVTSQARETRIKKYLTGDSHHDVHRRTRVLNKITHFVTPETHCPEQKLHTMVISVLQGDDLGENDVISAAQSVVAVNDAHCYVDAIIKILGEEREHGLRRIVDVAAKSLAWEKYVALIREWFDEKHSTLVENVTT